MTKYARSVLPIYFAIALITTSCAQSQDCVEGINKLPMYGGIKKCAEQIEFDRKFVAAEDKLLSRKQSTEHFVKRGWEYLYAKKLDTAMMRFNQAWLLDSLNAEIYWGYADILGMQGKFKESLPFFEKSIKLNATNAKVLQDMSTSYGNVFFETKDVKYLNSTISVLKQAIKINPYNPVLYGQLTGAYSYFTQKDSARKYLQLTDQIDPKAVNPEVRKMIAISN